MTFGRIFLWIAALMSLAAGTVYLFSPQGMATSAGFGDLPPGGMTDVRATYGGFQIGMGLFLAWTALDPGRIRSGLLLTLLAFGALASSRAIGVTLDGSLNEFHRSGLIFEVAFTALALAAFLKTPDPAAGAPA
jgi:hypothetical protein